MCGISEKRNERGPSGNRNNREHMSKLCKLKN